MSFEDYMKQAKKLSLEELKKRLRESGSKIC